MIQTSSVPRFYLYGEPHQTAESRFVHVEDLDDRSRPSEWTIKPHAHAELNHIFHMQSGGGSMRAEAEQLTFDAPCLLLVPAGVVHGFAWQGESVGSVITLSSSYLHRIADCDPGLSQLFAAAEVCALDQRDSDVFATLVKDLMIELGWAAPGHKAAVEACLLKVLVNTVRADHASKPLHLHIPGREVALVARLRERVERRFRLREPIASHAAELGTSQARLRAACAAVAGQSPMAILDQRAILEAQRSLLYSDLSIAEIADGLGFTDAAYFSRFFTKHSGASPRHFRAQRRSGTSFKLVPDV